MSDEPAPEPASPPFPTEGRLAGIDYGSVRVGVAVCDSRQTLAGPFEMYARRTRELDADYFRRLTTRERIAGYVVGLPIHLDGGESAKSVEARAFGRWLAEVTATPVVFYDERFSSAQADEALAMGQLTKKRRKERRDMLAAQIMLAAFLESKHRGAVDPGSIDDRRRR